MARSFSPWLVASVALHASLFTWAVHAPSREKHVAPPPAALAGGDTFDVDPPNDSDETARNENATESTPQDSDPAAGERATLRRRHRHGSPGKQGEPTSSSAVIGALFGAAGDRAAVDLSTAFTRTWPQVASADHAWEIAPFGLAGDVDVVLRIDDAGTLVETHVDGTGATLRASVERTLSLLRHRVFVSVGGYVTTLHVSASVARDAVHDGLHGDVFAVGGSFTEGEGDAFFALSIGRRVDVHVTKR